MADRNDGEQPKEEEKERTKTDEEVELSSENRRRVRRRLDFGENVVKELMDITDVLHLSSEEIHHQRQKAIEKWNFDFENEVPLDGNWEWEKIPVQSTESKEIVCSMEKKCRENRTV